MKNKLPLTPKQKIDDYFWRADKSLVIPWINNYIADFYHVKLGLLYTLVGLKKWRKVKYSQRCNYN